MLLVRTPTLHVSLFVCFSFLFQFSDITFYLQMSLGTLKAAHPLGRLLGAVPHTRSRRPATSKVSVAIFEKTSTKSYPLLCTPQAHIRWWCRVNKPRALTSSCTPNNTKVLASLKEVPLSAEDASKHNDCAVCLAELEAGQPVLKLACGHIYHGALSALLQA